VFASGQGLQYTTPAALSGTIGFTMIYLETVATAPGFDSAGNGALTIWNGASKSAGIFRFNAPYQTMCAALLDSNGVQHNLTVTGTVPLGDVQAGVLTYDGTNGSYFRVKDLQGSIDTTTTGTCGTITPFNSTEEITVHGQLGPNQGAPYASTVPGWLMSSGSMTTWQINAILTAWQARLQYNPPTSQSGGSSSSGTATALALSSGTIVATGPGVAIVNGTLEGTGSNGGVTQIATSGGITGGSITTTGTITLSTVNAVTHQWLVSVSGGSLQSSQPAFSDLSGVNLSNTLASGTFSVGNGSIVYGNAGQVSSNTSPTNLQTTNGTLSLAGFGSITGQIPSVSGTAFATAAQGTLASTAIQGVAAGTNVTTSTSGGIVTVNASGGGGGGGTVGPYTALSSGTSITITCNSSTSGTNNTLAISGTQNQLVFSGTASGDFGSLIVTSTGVATLQYPVGANLSTLTLTGTAYLGWQITTGSSSLWVQNLNASLVSSVLVGGSATVNNALLVQWPHPIPVDTGTGITNLGTLTVNTTGSTATLKSSNVLDTSSFDLHIIPGL
jgi:hypothetical protein